MVYVRKPLANHPNIVVYEFSDPFLPQETIQSALEVIEYAKDLPRPFYSLTDWRKVTGNLGVVLKNVRIYPEVKKQLDEAEITPVFINSITNPWLRLARDAVAKFGTVFVFETVEAAVTYIEWQEQLKSKSS